MKRQVKSDNKKITLNQVFFFNGSKFVMEVVDGEGFVEFDEEKVNPQYVERSILSRLHLHFVDDGEKTVEQKMENSKTETEPAENKEDSASEVAEEKKEEKPKKTTRKKTTKSRKKKTTK